MGLLLRFRLGFLLGAQELLFAHFSLDLLRCHSALLGRNRVHPLARVLVAVLVAEEAPTAFRAATVESVDHAAHHHARRIFEAGGHGSNAALGTLRALDELLERLWIL